MKIVLIILGLSIAMQMLVFAQKNKRPDYVVLTSGDTLYGKVEYMDEDAIPLKFHKKIRILSNDGRLKRLDRKEVAAFQTNNMAYESFFLHQSSQKVMLVNPTFAIDLQNGKQEFLKVVRKGKLSHYELEWIEQGTSAVSAMTLFKKEKDSFFIRADQGVFGLKKNVLQEYFTDCPSLRKAILDYQVKDVFEVMDYYNQNCLN